MGLMQHEIAEIAAAGLCTALFVVQIRLINTRLLLILWLTVIVEQFAKLIAAAPGKYLLYNVFTVVECFYYVWFLSIVLVNPAAKKILRIAFVFWGMFVVINFAWGQGPTSYNHFSRLANSLLVAVGCLCGFWQLAVSNSIKPRFTVPAMVAVLSGLILFYCGNFVLYISFSWLLKNYAADAVFLYKTINHNLNIALYSLICLGLLLEKSSGNIKKLSLDAVQKLE